MPLPIFSTLQSISSFHTGLLEKRMGELNNLASGEPGSYFEVKDVISAVSGETKVQTIDSRTISNEYLMQRSEFMVGQWNRLADLNTKLRETIQDARSMTIAPDTSFPVIVRSILQDITFELNSQFLGKTPLSGQFDNQPATVDLTTLAPLPSTALPDASYYTGGDAHMILSVSETKSIDVLPLNAADPSVQWTICAARMCLGADYTNTNDPRLIQALNLLDESQHLHYPFTLMMSGNTVQQLEAVKDSDSLMKINLIGQIQTAAIESLLDVLREQQETELALDVSHFMNVQWLQNLKEFAKLITST